MLMILCPVRMLGDGRYDAIYYCVCSYSPCETVMFSFDPGATASAVPMAALGVGIHSHKMSMCSLGAGLHLLFGHFGSQI